MGFEYFYGFVDGDTSQWQPNLFRNTTAICAVKIIDDRCASEFLKVMVEMTLRLQNIDFVLVGLIEPERDATGTVIEDHPQSKYRNSRALPLNRHGQGPFCRFSIPRGWSGPGVYALTMDGTAVYVGKCDTPLGERFGARGYGVIHPRNCFQGGQSTNCRINSLILQHAKAGHRLELRFHQNIDKTTRSALESQLIRSLRPPWNVQQPWAIG